MYDKETIIAPITSSIGGSVGIIRLSGKDAIRVSSRFFSNKNLEKPKGNSNYHGYLNDENGNIIDEVLISVFISPGSYTGEDVIEINHHNNSFIINDILNLFHRQNIKFAKPGEFTLRAFLNGKIDLLQAEAISDLITAQTKSATRNSLRKLSRELSLKIELLRNELINITSHLELEIDFSQEELEFVNKSEIYEKLSDLKNEISKMIESYKQGIELQDGISLALVGETNVGKSSIMNLLTGKSRSIVSNEHGTTRDYVTENIILDEIKIKLVDTAGLREASNIIEQEGIQKTINIINEVNYLLFIIDISSYSSSNEFELVKELIDKNRANAIIVGNKSDLGINTEKMDFITTKGLSYTLTSIHKPETIQNLSDIILAKIKPKNDEETIFITNERELLILKTANINIQKTIDTKNKSYSNEFLIEDIKEIISNLEYLTGRITNDDILNNIFRKFCIGK